MTEGSTAKAFQSCQSVVELIRSEIRTGNFPVGSMIPAEVTLATSIRASRGTVRRAIDSLIESGDLVRTPHARPRVGAGRAAATLAKDIVVWVIRPVSDPVALQLIKGVSQGLKGSRHSMVVREPSRLEGSVVRDEERRLMIELLKNDEVAGAIIEKDPYTDDGDVLAELAERKHLVFVDVPPPPNVNADHVGTANLISARDCVEHLIELGHSRIACVTDTDVPEPAKDRIRGYWRAMRQAGLESLGSVTVACDLSIEEGLDRSIAGPFAEALRKNLLHPGWPIRAIHEILSMNPRPTALFVCHDAMAIWICALLEGRGLRVPEDISVIGFDWTAGFEKSVPDILTTAAQDFEGFGKHAANLLLDRLHGEVHTGRRQILLNAPLVRRSSTASDLSLPPMKVAKETRA